MPTTHQSAVEDHGNTWDPRAVDVNNAELTPFDFLDTADVRQPESMAESRSIAMNAFGADTEAGISMVSDRCFHQDGAGAWYPSARLMKGHL